MSKNNIKIQGLDKYAISSLMTPKTFTALPEESQKIVIDTVREGYNKEKDGGILGKILGTNKINVSMHITFILCILLVIVGCCLKDKAIWDKIFTIIATSIGYIFGNSTEK
ncbi:MAG: hypothetical protein IJS39_11595 [Synergistaceae bacterium]|nr:hypothetical protein [Synergistaceae bacterium]